MTTRPLPAAGRGRGPARRPRRAASAFAVLLGLAALSACGAADPPKAHGAVYAALGDSESAGAGIAPTGDSGCLRSERNYPGLVYKKMRFSSFEDVSCSGAMTTNLLRPQFAGDATNDPQLDALGSRTRVVTLTIGLNDDKLAFGLLAACLSPSGDPSNVCRTVLGASDQQVDQQLTKAAQRVEETLKLIRRTAPKARVILVGYPRYLPDSGSCPGRYPVVAAMEPRLRSVLQTVNEKWKAAAASAGADYIDTYALSKGHDVCSEDPWVNGYRDQPGKAVALHPFEDFHAAVAKQIVALLKKGQ